MKKEYITPETDIFNVNLAMTIMSNDTTGEDDNIDETSEYPTGGGSDGSVEGGNGREV